MFSETKHSLFVLLEEVIKQQGRLNSLTENKSNSRINTKVKRNIDSCSLIYELIINLEALLHQANRLHFIETTEESQKILLEISRHYVIFFSSKIAQIKQKEIFHHWNAKRKELGYESKYDEVGPFLLSIERNLHIQARDRMVKKATETILKKTSKCGIERKIRLPSEFHLSFDEEYQRKPLTFEQAVLIIQKVDKFFRATRRQSVEQHRTKPRKSITTEEEAATLIQSKIRGHMARKIVRQMRVEEMDRLGLSVQAVLKRRSEERKVVGLVAESSYHFRFKAESLPELLESLRSNFSNISEPTTNFEEEFVKDRIQTEKLYLLLIQRGILRSKLGNRTHSMFTYVSPVKYKNSIFEFDIKRMLEAVMIYPLLLSTWKIALKPQWVLLVGGEKAGKTCWADAIASRTSATLLYVTSKTVMSAPKTIAQWISKLSHLDKTVLVVLDRLEIFLKAKPKDNLTRSLYRNFMKQLRDMKVHVVGMSRLTDIDSSIKSMFEGEINLNFPDFSVTYDLCVDLLSIGWEKDQLRKMPETISEVHEETLGKNCGEIITLIRNSWFRN